jgi:cellulose biosynthesis protein BcsQ
MEGKKILRIDLDELCSAMEDSSDEHNYYLDLGTGKLLLISDYMDDDESKKLKDKIYENFDRYEQLPKAISFEGYEDMEDFIGTVSDDNLAELLRVAMNGKGAFRRFKDVLEGYPEERERWFQFKNDKLKERALEWLENIGVSLS